MEYKLKKVAEIVRVSRFTIRRWISDGLIRRIEGTKFVKIHSERGRADTFTDDEIRRIYRVSIALSLNFSRKQSRRISEEYSEHTFDRDIMHLYHQKLKVLEQL